MDSPQSLVGKVIKGYELREEIGTGGFGAVYRAEQPSVGREVAVKIILPEYANNPAFIRRFETEAQLVARLEHLHIVPLYDYWREPNGAYLVMRFLRGGSARDMLKAHGAWEVHDVSRLLDQITSALAVAHRNQVIHRDLKPDNVLLDEVGNFFLADFGIAKDMSSGSNYKTGPVIGSPAYFSPEQIRALPITTHTDIYSLGICLYELLAAQHPFTGTKAHGMVFKHLTEPLPHIREIRPGLPEAVNMVIQRATAKNPDDRFSDILGLASAFRQAIGVHRSSFSDDTDTIVIDPKPIRTQTTPAMGTSVPEPENPYKGLRPFKEADTDDFFGRDTLVNTLVERLRHERWLTVIGPSGSGKSSAVYAGLIPALRRGTLPGSDHWFYVTIHPGIDPLGELENALLRIAVNPPSSLMKQLEESERGLLRVLKRTLPDDHSELVMMIDQFEELFTLVDDEALRLHFMRSLLTAVNEPRSRLRVVLTLRADFYDRPLLYPEFGDYVRRSTEVVLPMNRRELEEAILRPAERMGLIVEPQLVAAIIRDVGVGTGVLPQLQYALTELYERRDGRVLTLEAYREIGGVSGALARRAEELYTVLWEPTKSAAEQVFLRLVTLGEGTEDTRRRVLRAELLSMEAQQTNQAVSYVLDQFGKYRLLTFNNDPQTREPTVEIAHEALIREWTRLRDWLENSRVDLRFQRQIAAAAQDWQENNQDPSYLARGTRLAQLREWSENTRLQLSELERDYIDASIAADRARQAAEAQRIAREEELEARSQGRLQAIVIVTTVAAGIGILLAGLAFNQTRIANENANERGTAVAVADEQRITAERNAEEAQSLALAAAAQQAFTEGNNDLAVSLARESVQITDPPTQAQRVLAQIGYAPGTRQRFTGHTNFVLDAVFSPEGTHIVSASADSTLRLWDIASGESVQVFRGHSAAVNGVDISADGTRIVSVGADRTVRVWQISTGEQLNMLETTASVLTVRFALDSDHVLLGDTEGTIYLWDLQSSTFDTIYSGHRGQVWEIDYSPTGRVIASASSDGTVRLWNATAGNELRRLSGHEGRVLSVTFNPGGQTVVAGGDDQIIRLWDTRFGQNIRQFFGHTGVITSVGFSPDGQQIISGSEDQTIRLWDVNTASELLRLQGHTASVSAVHFNPGTQQVLSASRDNTLRLWDLQSGAELQRFVWDDSDLVDVRSSSGFALVGVAGTGLELWEFNSGSVTSTIAPANRDMQRLTAISLSPNDRLAATGSRDGALTVWDLNSGLELLRIMGHDSTVTAVAFTPNNREVISTSIGGRIVRADAGTGEIFYRQVIPVPQVNAMRMIPNSNQLLLATNTGQILTLDPQDATITKVIGSHDGAVTSLFVSPDGTQAVSGGADRSVRLWDLTATLPSEAQIVRLDGHEGHVTGVTLTEDERYILSVSEDGTLRIWDLALSDAIQVIRGHEGAIYSLALVPNTNTVLTIGADRTLRKWQILDLPTLQTWIADNRYGEELTCLQREQYRIPPYCD